MTPRLSRSEARFIRGVLLAVLGVLAVVGVVTVLQFGHLLQAVLAV